MDIWRQIGIEETRDKERIKQAYRERLTVTNPEDKPEEFMLLRQAYEKALQYADSAEPHADKDDLPLAQWMEKVGALYNNFSDRIDHKKWIILLQDNVCQNIDSKSKARDVFLEFLMEHIYFSQSVLIILDRHFHFTDMKEELFEEYPRAFVQNIILDAIERPEYPPYDTLSGDENADFDGYLSLDAQLGESIAEGNVEKSKRIIDQMEETGVRTPYFYLAKAKVYCQEDDFRNAGETLSHIDPIYHGVTDIRLLKADVAFLQGQWESAKPEYVSILEVEPESEWAKQGLARCLVEEGAFSAANDLLRELLQTDPYNESAEECLNKSNSLLLKQLETSREAGQLNGAGLLDLGWCYFETGQYESALSVLQQVEPTEDLKAGYYNLAGRVFLYLEDDEKALDALKKWESLLQEIKEIDDKTAADKRERLGYAYHLQSVCYARLEEPEKALLLIEKAYEMHPADLAVLERKGQILDGMGDYPAAVETYSEVIKTDPTKHRAYILRALALKQMQYHGQAFDDCERAIELYPYELGAHICRIEILIEVEERKLAWEAFHALEEDDLTGSQMELLRGRLLEADGQPEDAEQIYYDILERDQNESDTIVNLESMAEVYYHLALLKYDEDAEDFNEVMGIVEAGLETENYYVPLLYLKAEVHEKCGDYRSAMSTYRRILKAAPRQMGIYGLIDNMYRELDAWEHALKYANLQLEQDPSAYYYMRRAQILICLGRLDEGRSDLEICLEMDPDLVYAYDYMGTIFDFEGNDDQALEYYLKAIHLSEETQELCAEAYRDAANFYCRKQKHNQAIGLLETSFEREGDAKDIYEQIEINRLGGRFDLAVEALDRFFEFENMDKESFFYKWEKAHVFRDSRQEEKAFDIYDIEGVIEPMARKEAAIMLFYQGKYRRALKLLRKAIQKLEGRDINYELEVEEHLQADFYLWAARCSLQVCNEEDARMYAKEGLKKIPEDFEEGFGYCLPSIYEMLGGLYTCLGDTEKAFKVLKKGLGERRCDNCNYERCIDIYFELGYLHEREKDYEKAGYFYEEGLKVSPFDYTLNSALNTLQEREKC